MYEYDTPGSKRTSAVNAFTDNCVGLLLNLLHVDAVHLTFGEGVGLLGRTSIAFPFFAIGHSVA